LTNYVSAAGCKFTAGETIKRNTCRNPWSYDLDLRFSQELPFLGSLTGIVDDKVELFLDFDNFLNFIDSKANRVIFRPSLVDLVDPSINIDDPDSMDPDDRLRVTGFDNQGRYTIGGFNPDDDQDISISGSVWKIQVGVRYEF
jgi:hypothetical protein